jgi:hypothetical protein
MPSFAFIILQSSIYVRLCRCPLSWKMEDSLISVWKWFYILCLYDDVILCMRLNLFIHLSFIYNCTLIWSYFFTVFFLFTFVCIFSSTSMLEIKTIYTPKGINVFKTFFFNLFQLENQMINKYYGTKKKYAFNIPIIWVWFTFAL